MINRVKLSTDKFKINDRAFVAHAEQLADIASLPHGNNQKINEK